ncbi:dimethylmenaquinone methyltransferase [Methanocaldococcus villosus KIN24-T80]|uniref:Dimethylmenaquinone methyltransferase n=1 Tax=Methanocaldococcus villosus KIN24-T80 TaxID=1069083 RepID=N6VPI7_9EURY|nr:dimethylmenaquinone methyltransferase [Methanocaldococcus villosus]ENN95805.1 dimethylmenaquinone methyltransferase [Methanocaldococcus villosus KIN24-T80]
MFSVPNLCDAGALYIKNLKPVLNNQKVIIGEVVTVRTNDDWGCVVKAISYAKGKIIFVKNEGEKAVWGGLASLNAKIKGVKAVVIYGAIRDIEDIISLKFPVFYKEVNAEAGKPLNVGEINIPIDIYNITVSPGDYIACDMNGVCLIKRRCYNEIMERVKKVKSKENKIKERIMKGQDLSEILNLR